MLVNIYKSNPGQAMRLTAENKERQRARIRAGAARVLRRDGYGGVNLDAVMAEAGLTRGAFYAHFGSKADLLAEVAAEEHPLRTILAAREGATPQALLGQMQEIFAGYLDAGNLPKVYEGCTVASLQGDIARATPEVRAAFEAGWHGILSEMARGQTAPDPGQLRAALVLATGAVTTAQACASPDRRRDILDAARPVVADLLRRACAV